MELHELADSVTDPESFLRFVNALIIDRQRAVELEAKSPSSPFGPDACGWENTSIEAFLESANAWATDSAFGESRGLQPTNPWGQFAAFLYSGKIYE